MARTDLETLVFNLDANTAKMTRAFEKMNRDVARQMGATEKRAKQMQSSLNATFSKIGGKAGGIGKSAIGGVLASIGASASVQGIENAVASLAKIGDVAGRIGATTDEIQRLRYAVEQSGGSADDADKAIQRFAKEAGTRGSDVQKIFAQAGVAITDVKGNLLPTMVLFERYLDIIAKSGNAQTQLAISAKGFGREGGNAMVLVGQQGSAAFKQIGDEAQRAGNVIDSEVIKRSQELDDSLTALKNNIAGLGNALLAEFGGPLLESAMQDILSFLRETRAYIEFFKGISRNAAGNFDANQILQQFQATREGIRQQATEPLRVTITKPGGAPVAGAGGAGLSTATPTENAYQRETKSIQEKIAALEIERKTVGLTAGAAAELTARLELENAAKEAGIALSPKVVAEINARAQAMGDLVTSVEKAKSAIDAINEAQKAFASEASGAFEQLIVDGNSLRDVLADVARNLARMALQASIAGTGPLAGLLGTASTTGGAGGLAGLLFGGFRAGGGAVSAGKAYMVGERGRELFVPKVAGRVIPNDRLQARGGGQAVTVNMPVNISANGADQASLMRVAAELASLKQTLPERVTSVVRAHRSRLVR